jgi:nucleotide-binding universal stress UspA family protein
MSKIILVPTDFTPIADNALEHAVAVANTINAKITLIHIVPKKSHVEEAKTRLSMMLERPELKSLGVEIDPIVRVGTIFEDIGDVAEELSADLIIMGTHGMKGLQFITGSRALKVITSSSTPFVVVQESKIKETGYDDIVVPLDLSKETKQKLTIVAQMAKYFKSRVHLIIPRESDEFLKNQLDRNLNYAKQFFSEQQIELTTKVSDEKSGDFDDGIIQYASEINADLIAIMNLAANSLVGMLGSSYVQNILTNEAQVPVLIVNPINTSIAKNVIFT